MTLNEELDVLIPRYAENKEQMETFKKSVDRDNAKIKSLMTTAQNYHYKTDKYKADCIVSNRETMQEDVLLSLFSYVPAFVSVADDYGIIKTKPYIDFDALEKAIYDNKLTNEQLLELNKAKEVKEVVTLRVSKIKDKGEDVT